MDLYRTLRISLYLLVGTGAFAISVAEGSIFYLVLIAVLGTISFLTIDRGKAKPLSTELTAGATVILFYLTLRSMFADDLWRDRIPATVAHFLCVFQGLLFFSAYSPPVLLAFCGSTLVVVVMSGVVQSGPSLVARVACFVAITVWTLYIHAVWRSRQEFAGQPAVLSGSISKPPFEPATGEPLQRLPEGTFWGTVTMVAGMTAACIALGVTIFFSAPRLEGILAFFEKKTPANETKNSNAPIQSGRKESDVLISGNGSTVNLNGLGHIHINSRTALTVVFSKPAAQLAGKKSRILLKSASFSEYRDGAWTPDPRREPFESKNGAPISPADPSLSGSIYKGDEAVQSLEAAALSTVNLLAAGPIVRVGVRRIEVDAEGSVRNSGDSALDRYTLTIRAPFDAADLPQDAAADHSQLQRYVLQNGLSPNDSDAVGQLARQITRRNNGSPSKARDIQRWLETYRKYSLNMEDVHPAGDPLVHFLLTSDVTQAQGHCGMFASAFVLLSRANGMPARLCVGFAAHLDPADPQSKTAIAKNSDAHAWAEIYYKNIGWVAYDPTPAAAESIVENEARIATAKTSDRPANVAAPAAIPASIESDVSHGVVQDAWDTLLKYNGYEQRKWYEKLSGTQGSGSGSILTGRGWGGWLGATLAWAGIAAAIGWLVQMFARRNTRRKYASATGGIRSRAAVAFYNEFLQALSRRGYSRRPDQTPREFADFVLKRGGETFAPVREITTIFEGVRYGGGELAQEEFNRLHEALDKIREMTF